MSELDEVAGVIGEIESASTAHNPVEQEDVSEAQAEGAEQTQTQESNNAEETGQSEEGQTQQTEAQDGTTKTQTSESSTEQTDETSKTENQTEQEFPDWHKELPPPPPEYEGKKPEYNDQGQIVNMNPQEYEEYILGVTKAANAKDNYNLTVETKALDVAERILPDMKSNQAIRQMVESARIASILKGNPIDTVQAALQVRDALGIAPERLQAAKAEGANNAKASITVQKNAALENGSSQAETPKETKAKQVTELQKRVARGDDLAFAELLGVLDDEGKISH